MQEIRFCFVANTTDSARAVFFYGRLVESCQNMSRRFRIVLVLAVVLASVLVGARGIVRQQHAGRVIRECMAATEALHNSPPGFERGEEFIRRIRAIDTRGAPNDLVAALHEHIDLLDRSVRAAREGKDHEQLDKQVAEAKERFATKVKKYW